MIKKTICLVLAISLISLSPVPAFAVGSGGFENSTFSARQLARGGASTATPDEPASISYNPAGIADLRGVQVQSNASFLSLITSYHSDVYPDTRSTGTLKLVPTGYVTINPGKIFNDRITFGVGSDAPFGLSDQYSSTHAISRYTGFSNWIKMYTIKPTMAVKVNKWFSVGGGPVYYRMFDFGSVLAYPNNVISAPFGITTPDGQLRANLSGNTWGWQLGALLRPLPKHRLGFYFRSPAHMLLKGQVKVENANLPVLLGGNGIHRFETGAHTKLMLPLNFTVGYAYQINDRAHVEADFTYTHWSVHKRLYINSDPVNPVDDLLLQGIGNTDKDYKNGYGLQLGGDYKLTKKLTLHGGSYFYWTPVPTAHWSPALPDSNRLCFSLGADYEITKNLIFGLAYWQQFFLTRRISNEVGQNPSMLMASDVDGKYFTFLQAFTVSLTLKWDNLFGGGKEPDVASTSKEPESPMAAVEAVTTTPAE